jgi:hypothetical protein
MEEHAALPSDQQKNPLMLPSGGFFDFADGALA